MFGLARKTAPVVIEEYQIETVESEGFRKLHIRFQDVRGKIHRFEMHPAHAHHFSDDVLRNVTKAMAPKGP